MRSALAASFGAILVAVSLASCAARPTIDSTSVARVPGRPAVTFSGPWAEDFRSTYEDATTRVERGALKDGAITGEEYAYFQSAILRCLATNGVTATFSGQGIDYSNPRHTSQKAINACIKDNGIAVISLKDSIERNPRNLDEAEIMVACLKRAGVVGPNFTKDDYLDPSKVEPFLSKHGFDQCSDDPLHYAK